MSAASARRPRRGGLRGICVSCAICAICPIIVFLLVADEQEARTKTAAAASDGCPFFGAARLSSRAEVLEHPVRSERLLVELDPEARAVGRRDEAVDQRERLEKGALRERVGQ